jgi:hypothetical protein
LPVTDTDVKELLAMRAPYSLTIPLTDQHLDDDSACGRKLEGGLSSS